MAPEQASSETCPPSHAPSHVLLCVYRAQHTTQCCPVRRMVVLGAHERPGPSRIHESRLHQPRPMTMLRANVIRFSPGLQSCLGHARPCVHAVLPCPSVAPRHLPVVALLPVLRGQACSQRGRRSIGSAWAPLRELCVTSWTPTLWPGAVCWHAAIRPRHLGAWGTSLFPVPPVCKAWRAAARGMYLHVRCRRAGVWAARSMRATCQPRSSRLGRKSALARNA